MINTLSKLISWYRSPLDGDTSGTARTIVAHLIHEGHTPATTDDVRAAFAVVHDREATDFEAILAFDFVDSFGMLA